MKKTIKHKSDKSNSNDNKIIKKIDKSIDEIIKKKIDPDKNYELCNVLENELSELLDNKTSNNEIDVLVLGGGGSKGVAHLGAIDALIHLGLFNGIHTYAGTSIGACTLALINFGYTPLEVKKLLVRIGIKNFRNNNAHPIKDFGMDNGERVLMIVEKLMLGKGLSSDTTFKDLYKKTKKKLYITGACLNDKQAYYFSVDSYPNMKVITAIRITMSVPLLWTPVKFENKLFVDGGLIDNFPINMFTNNKSSKVLGIHLNTKKSTIDSVNNLEEYLISAILCGLEGLTYNACRGYEDNVIMIDIKDVDITNFDINENKINEMYNIGYNAILNRYDKK